MRPAGRPPPSRPGLWKVAGGVVGTEHGQQAHQLWPAHSGLYVLEPIGPARSLRFRRQATAGHPHGLCVPMASGTALWV